MQDLLDIDLPEVSPNEKLDLVLSSGKERKGEPAPRIRVHKVINDDNECLFV